VHDEEQLAALRAEIAELEPQVEARRASEQQAGGALAEAEANWPAGSSAGRASIANWVPPARAPRSSRRASSSWRASGIACRRRPIG
jgi:hypothetical protein